MELRIISGYFALGERMIKVGLFRHWMFVCVCVCVCVCARARALGTNIIKSHLLKPKVGLQTHGGAQVYLYFSYATKVCEYAGRLCLYFKKQSFPKLWTSYPTHK